MVTILNLHDNDIEWRYRLFFAFFDSENIWFGEIISSLSQLLTKIWSLWRFHGGHFEFCMITMSNNCIVCFIALLDTKTILFGKIIFCFYLNYWWRYHNFSDFMAAILNFAWEECFDTNLRTPSNFFLFCSLFWTFWYRWHILTIKIPREFIYEHKHPHYIATVRAWSHGSV